MADEEIYVEVWTVNAQNLLDLIEEYEYQADIFIASQNISELTDVGEADEGDICWLNSTLQN